MIRTSFAVIGFVVVALVVGVCVACDDDSEESWVPGVESSERPGGRDGPGRDGDDGKGSCDGSCGNRPGNDCNQSENCSDDDQVQVGPICVQPESCRFG